jgi:hypothetical protein
MERGAAPQRVGLGWIERAYASVPLSPAAIGAAFAAVLVLAFGVTEFAQGRLLALRDVADAGALGSLVRIAVVNCLIAAYLPSAYVILVRGYRETLDQLRGALDCSDEEMAHLRERIGHYGLVAVGLAGLSGLVFGLGITRVTTPSGVDPWLWSALPQEVRWHRVLGLWHGPWAGIFVLALTVEGRRLAALTTRCSRVDLLDLRPLRPFTRQALQNALLLAGAAGIGLLSFVWSGFWDVVLGWWIASVTVIALGLLAALLPLHRLIRDAKRTQLDWCRDALIRERTKLQAGDAGSRIDQIVAYRGVVEDVSAWPFDTSTFVRLLLYLFIPLGSWAGGAIVERLIDSLLG